LQLKAEAYFAQKLMRAQAGEQTCGDFGAGFVPFFSPTGVPEKALC